MFGNDKLGYLGVGESAVYNVNPLGNDNIHAFGVRKRLFPDKAKGAALGKGDSQTAAAVKSLFADIRYRQRYFQRAAQSLNIHKGAFFDIGQILGHAHIQNGKRSNVGESVFIYYLKV